MTAALQWLLRPVPRGRVAVLRTVAYGFVLADLYLLRTWVWSHGDLPPQMYHPLAVARALSLPVPTPALVTVVGVALTAAAAVALTGRWPRAAGAAVFVLYLQWMLVAFSYGKVDHDRLALLMALAVLPTAGSARWGERDGDVRSGWAVHMVQIAVVSTYLFAAFAKLRFGGLEWLTGATLSRAVLRRGSALADLALDAPEVLVAAQFAIVAFELGSPLMLVTGTIGRAYVGLAAAFHVVVFAALGIMFWPHLVMLSSFLPLERITSEIRAGRLPRKDCRGSNDRRTGRPMQTPLGRPG